MDALEDVEIIGNLENRHLRERQDPLLFYSDDEFKNRFRLSKNSFGALVHELRAFVPQSAKSWGLSLEERLCITLRFYATNCLQASVGDFIRIHKGTISKVIHAITTALCELRINWIRWYDPLNIVSAGFREIAGFPAVIGCIDGTHIKIQKPQENAENYINRKGIYSINTQVVCDHKLRIVDIVCRWPGSVHDARIFENSIIKHNLATRILDGIILGDSGYPCNNYILTPVLRPRREEERRYNASHIRTRNSVERCFGVLKRRFLCLEGKLRYSENFCCKIILACAILHNFAIENDGIDFENEFENELAPDEVNDIPNNNQHGNAYRTIFINRHFSN